MPRIRFSFTLLLVAFVGTPSASGGGPEVFAGKKTDSARIPALFEVLKSETDEKKRSAAADELGRADVRYSPDVIPALVAALQKDASAMVRAEAAAALGRLGSVLPLAGLALEGAASGDPSPLVRLAAKKSLWEYHLNGYRSPKGSDASAAQTIEPPFASPTAPRPASAVVVAPREPVAPLIPKLPPTPTPVPPLPPVTPPNGPRVPHPSFLTEFLFGHRTPPAPTESIAPYIPNATAEPPIAKRAAVTIPPFPFPLTTPPAPPPTIAIRLPPLPAPPSPDYVPTLPPLIPEVPSVVLPPGATPMPVALPTDQKIPATLPPRP